MANNENKTEQTSAAEGRKKKRPSFLRRFFLLLTVLIIVLAVIFVLGSLILPGLFSISPLTGQAWLITIGLMAASVPVMILLTQLSYLLGVKRPPSLIRRAKTETHS